MRNQAIDNYRGLAILLVVLAHVTFVSALISEVIYSFLMTAFFMLSGFLFNPSKAGGSPKAYVQEKFYRLVIPAWVMGMICGIPFLVFFMLGMEGVDSHVFFTRLVGTLVGYPDRDLNFYCTPIWFLYCLFIVEALATFVVYRFKEHYRTVFFAIGLFGLCLSIFTEIYIPFNAHVALLAFFYFSFGSCLRGIDVFNIRLGTAHAVMFVVAVGVWATMIALSDEKFLIASSHIGTGWNILYNLTSSFCGTYVLYYIARFLSSSQFLSWLGLHTLPILGFNYMVDFAIFKILMHFSLYSWPLAFALQLVVFIPCVMLLDKTGLLGRIINGRVGPGKAGKPMAVSAR